VLKKAKNRTVATEAQRKAAAIRERREVFEEELTGVKEELTEAIDQRRAAVLSGDAAELETAAQRVFYLQSRCEGIQAAIEDLRNQEGLALEQRDYETEHLGAIEEVKLCIDGLNRSLEAVKLLARVAELVDEAQQCFNAANNVANETRSRAGGHGVLPSFFEVAKLARGRFQERVKWQLEGSLEAHKERLETLEAIKL